MDCGRRKAGSVNPPLSWPPHTVLHCTVARRGRGWSIIQLQSVGPVFPTMSEAQVEVSMEETMEEDLREEMVDVKKDLRDETPLNPAKWVSLRWALSIHC